MKQKKNFKFQEEEYDEEKMIEILVAKLGEFSTIDEVVKILKISRGSVTREIDSGKIVNFYIRRRVIILTRTLISIMKREK